VPNRSRAAFLALSLALAACSTPSPSAVPSPSASASPSASEIPSPSTSPGLPTVPDGALYYPDHGTTPGEIAQSEELAAPPGMRAWFIVYGSEGLDGSPVPVSGIVLTPTAAAPEGGFPVVAWAHGTTGIADQCAPSKQGIEGIPAEVRGLVARGYVVTATDYEGLGTTGIHPYLVGKSEARSVLDSIVAAQSLPEARAGTNSVVIGHSQGGHAALWSAELAPSYAPGMTLLGAFATSPPTDLVAWESWAFGEAKLGTFDPAEAPVLMFGVWNAVYDAPLTFLTNDGRQSALAGREACAPPPTSGTPYERDPAQISEWHVLLAGNSPGRTLTGVPMTVVSARGDGAVQYDSQVAGVTAMCLLGDTVEQRSIGGDHDDTFATPSAWADITTWIADRFAEASPVTTCTPGPSTAP
jgi:pimeloyl-ACP methyl ester carboxylesterase